jgi:hypothetical protein
MALSPIAGRAMLKQQLQRHPSDLHGVAACALAWCPARQDSDLFFRNKMKGMFNRNLIYTRHDLPRAPAGNLVLVASSEEAPQARL